MKEHILAKMINDLRDTAQKYHGHDCLRELIRTTVLQALHDDVEWYRQYEALAHVKPSVGVKIPDMRLKQEKSKDFMVKL